MSLPEGDNARLRHRLDAARAALGFVADRTRDGLSADLMLQSPKFRGQKVAEPPILPS